MKRKIALIAAGIAATMVALTGCSVPSTAPDEIYVHKGAGITEGQEGKGCVQPATREIFWGQGMGDDYFAYPSSQRVYAFTGDKNIDDGEPFTVVSKDQQTLTVPGTISFYLNTDCKVLQRFHDQIGNRDHAYMEDGQTTPGWSKILNVYFRQPLDATLDRIAKQYTWKQLYSDVSIKDEMNKEVNASLQRLVNQQFLGDEEFFINFESLIQQPRASKDLVAAVEQEETSKAQAAATQVKAEADAKALQAKAEAEVAQKQAELKVAQIEQQIKKAEIAAYGDPKNYVNYLAVQKGLNPFQPTYGNALVNP